MCMRFLYHGSRSKQSMQKGIIRWPRVSRNSCTRWGHGKRHNKLDQMVANSINDGPQLKISICGCGPQLPGTHRVQEFSLSQGGFSTFISSLKHYHDYNDLSSSRKLLEPSWVFLHNNSFSAWHKLFLGHHDDARSKQVSVSGQEGSGNLHISVLPIVHLNVCPFIPQNHIKVTRHLCFRNTKYLHLLKILACNGSSLIVKEPQPCPLHSSIITGQNV